MGSEYNDEIESKLDYLEIFTGKKIKLKEGTPAQLLQDLLEEKWKLKHNDKDMIVMQHLFEYELNDKTHKLTSSLVVIGDDENHTAMAKTVGLPVAIAVKNILLGNIKTPGVKVPVSKEIYEPVMKELKRVGMDFITSQVLS